MNALLPGLSLVSSYVVSLQRPPRLDSGLLKGDARDRSGSSEPTRDGATSPTATGLSTFSLPPSRTSPRRSQRHRVPGGTGVDKPQHVDGKHTSIPTDTNSETLHKHAQQITERNKCLFVGRVPSLVVVTLNGNYQPSNYLIDNLYTPENSGEGGSLPVTTHNHTRGPQKTCHRRGTCLRGSSEKCTTLVRHTPPGQRTHRKTPLRKVLYSYLLSKE